MFCLNQSSSVPEKCLALGMLHSGTEAAGRMSCALHVRAFMGNAHTLCGLVINVALEKTCYWIRFWTLQVCLLALTTRVCVCQRVSRKEGEGIFTSVSHALVKAWSSQAHNRFSQSPGGV